MGLVLRVTDIGYRGQGVGVGGLWGVATTITQSSKINVQTHN